jgi:predicted PurR-regulated permease PerM
MVRPSRGLFLLLAVLLGLVLILSLGGIASMVIIAALLAYIVDPVVTRLELSGISRAAATAIFFFILLGLIAGAIVVLTPIVSDQIELLRSEDATEQATLLLSRLEFAIHKHLGFMGLDQVRLAETLQTVKQAVREEVLRFVVEDSPSLIAHAVAIPIIMFFFLKDGRDMKKQFVRLVPNRYFEFSLDLLHKMDRQLGNFLRSQFLDALIFGVLSTLLLWMLDVRYFLLIGIFAGLANLVPYVGPVAGVVPAVVVSVLETGDVNKALMVIAGYVGLKLLDDVLVQPLVVSRGVNLHPLFVLLSILVGGNLFGILGMLLAVPCAGFVRVVLQESVVTFRKYRFS